MKRLLWFYSMGARNTVTVEIQAVAVRVATATQTQTATAFSQPQIAQTCPKTVHHSFMTGLFT